VKEDVIDLGKHKLNVSSLETTGPGPATIGFGESIGCPGSTGLSSSKYLLCAQGSPPVLFQQTSAGETRPVSSRAPVGFQDNSNGPKPACEEASRGTFYVEKGSGRLGGKPFLCIKTSGGKYSWIQLAATP